MRVALLGRIACAGALAFAMLVCCPVDGIAVAWAQEEPDAVVQTPSYTMTASKSGKWITKKSKGKKVKVGYRFSDGSYPARITKIGKTVYYFKDSYGNLGYAKSKRMVSVGDECYLVSSAGVAVKGWYRKSANTLYYFGGSYNAMVKNATKGGITLTSSGSAEMNLEATVKSKCLKVLGSITKDTDSKSEKLRKAWKWCTSKSRFSYVGYEFDRNNSTWPKRYANQMLSTKLGDCRGFACIFAALACEIGYEPYLVHCRVLGNRDHASDGFTRHCLVQINGKYYDPEADFAGWATGVYGDSEYATPMKSVKRVKWSKYDGTGAARGISKSFNNRVSFSIGVKSGSYYCYNKGKKLTGVYIIRGKLYSFDSKGYMSKTLFAKVQAAAKANKPWKTLRSLIGKPGSTKTSSSCYGSGLDHVYTYKNVRISTFEPDDGSEEIVLSCYAF